MTRLGTRRAALPVVLGQLVALVRALCRDYRYIVQLGMPKTGTSSTYFYFNQLGYKPCDAKDCNKISEVEDICR